jgi:formate hydrogenlyase subunit 6/NADH:ubiquinone oxidoreductase subunit I
MNLLTFKHSCYKVIKIYLYFVGMKTIKNTQSTNLNNCNGCNLCLLVCPIWQHTHDVRLTPHGVAKSVQNGAKPEQLKNFIRLCPMCGACEPICPQRIDLTNSILHLREEWTERDKTLEQNIHTWMQEESIRPPKLRATAATLLLTSKILREQSKVLSQIMSLLRDHAALAEDDGWDIAIALELGMKIPVQRLERFLSPLHSVKKLIVSDGIFYKFLRRWLPSVEIIGLGKILSSLKEVRKRIEKTDLYIIESRTYHADYENIVNYYTHLAIERQCQFNVDLQRIAIPTMGMNVQRQFNLAGFDYQKQIDWLLQGRDFSRILTESWEDKEILMQFTEKPVLHLSELAFSNA